MTLRGFGLTLDLTTGGMRNWYIDGEGATRWADNDELVRGPNGQQEESATPERYRPANGTEGDIFMESFCDRCVNGADCEIQDATMAFDVDDPEYPAEWIEDDDGPRCTAFVAEGPDAK